MDKFNFDKEIETITTIRDRLHHTNGKKVCLIEFSLTGDEATALVKALNACTTYYNFTKAIQQEKNDTESKNKELPKPSGNGTGL